jgi:phosphoglycolate phosphatase-like HAD superfamily hydrolase
MYASPKYMSYMARPIDGAKQLLKDLKKAGFKIIVITARVNSLHRSTRNLVKKEFPEVDDVYFVDITETKKDLFKKLKISYWVDDAPHEIKNSLTLGIKSFMISNKNTNYNWNMKKAAGLKSIKSVKELKLKDFSNG